MYTHSGGQTYTHTFLHVQPHIHTFIDICTNVCVTSSATNCIEMCTVLEYFGRQHSSVSLDYVHSDRYMHSHNNDCHL